ncbi:MAG: sensor histidine kinase [Akkermansiaceae bacterium]
MMIWVRLLVLWSLAGVTARMCAETEVSLTAISDIRQLFRADAAKALPVKLTGVAVYVGWDHLVLHDGRAAVFADFRFSKAKGLWKGPLPDLSGLKAGTEIEIEGVTDPGGFSPMVLLTRYQLLGTKPVPAPLRTSCGDLLSSAMDSQWVEVEGVVCRYLPESDTTGPACLTLVVSGHRYPIVFRHGLKTAPEDLVDAMVRVRGVVLDITNLRSEIAAVKMHSNGDADVDILKPPPADPFMAPRVALDQLILFSPKGDSEHRKVASGVVSFVVPGNFFYLTNGRASVRVTSNDPGIHCGDEVEVAGFVDRSRVLAGFSEACVRVVGQGPPPAPETATVHEILNPRTRSYEEMITEPGHPDRDGALLRFTGVLRRVLPNDKDGNTNLFVEIEETLVRVLLPTRDPASRELVSRWTEGSVVELSGICELEIERLDILPWFSITGFHLWLSSPDGLRIISTPPWWTPQRLGILLAGLMLLLCLALVWGYSMRRQVAKRGRQLAGEIAAREAAELEFGATMHERRRLANDLHDTLEQALTGLALQLEIVERSQDRDPERSARHLTLAQQFLARSRGEVHRTVWDLRTLGQDGRDFLGILEERAAAMVVGSSVSIAVTRTGDPFPLPDLVAGNLLLLAQEAVTNALKHARPTVIHVRLGFIGEHVELKVADDGRGFDIESCPGQSQGHFGLQGMHERVKRLGGTLEIQSIGGRGTSIFTRVPVRPTDPAAGGNPGSLHESANIPP